MYRDNLKIFLKGSRAKKEALQHKNPSRFDHFKNVWDLRLNPLVQGYPQQYVHGLCHWFPNGPPLSKIPLPVPVPVRPWGGTACTVAII